MYRLFASALALVAASPAFAGGFGLVFTGGANTSNVYFYDSANNNEQYKQVQLLPAFGTGLEFVLGDRDDRIQGIFRGYWLRDGAEQNPALLTDVIPPESVVANIRENPKDIGMATFGMSWGVYGDPEKFQLVLVSSAGAGFLTKDHSEFLIVQAGPGVSYRFARQMSAFLDLDYSVRFRKSFTHGPSTYLGVRYMFD